MPPRSSHFDGRRYYNPGLPGARGILDVLRWKLTSRPEASPRFVVDVKPSQPPARIGDDSVQVTLINHSTVLLQQRGAHFLTDPIWSERTSPVSWAGPRRRRAPGVHFEGLPRIDAVLLSHNHYDHLDLPTLWRLAQRGTTEYIVPAGVARLLHSEGIGPVRELDWGESLTCAGSEIHCVPAVHFSGRSLFDRNRTLWCGYVITTGSRVVYFAGDTGFGDHFAAVRARFGAPRLALLPIGAYLPRWFMAPIHESPEEAVRAHQILGATTSIAIHHGTFQLADDGLDTPRRRLRECSPGDSFLVLDNGQAVSLA